jgi:hypothetical protein
MAVRTPTGTLIIMSVGSMSSFGKDTYFKRKIHRQLPCSVIPPPRSGPVIKLSASTMLTPAMYCGNFLFGTISMNRS